jgi:hypothetical protein
MAITNSFREAVSNSNVKGIRIMMKDSLLVDPTFAEFNEMSRLASSVIGLYDQHDGRELQNDISTWDDNYMDKLMVQVVSNFSKDRLEHLKAVVKHLRPVASRSQSQSTTSQTSSSTPRQADSYSRPRTQQAQRSNYQEQKRYGQRNGNYRGVKIAAGAVIGGAVGGTIAGVSGGSVIIGVAVGAVVVGAAVAIATNGE